MVTKEAKVAPLTLTHQDVNFWQAFMSLPDFFRELKHDRS